MSTVLYAYATPKERLSATLDTLRALLLERHPDARRLAELAAGQLAVEPPAGRVAERFACEEAKQIAAAFDGPITVQLFDDDTRWVLRVIGDRQRIVADAVAAGDVADVETVVYDNRTDVPVAEQANRRVADLVDRVLRERRHLTAVLLDDTLLGDVFWGPIHRRDGERYEARRDGRA